MTSILFAIDMIFLNISSSDSSAVSPSTPKTLIYSLMEYCSISSCWYRSSNSCFWAFSNRVSIIDTYFSIAQLTASVTAGVTARTGLYSSQFPAVGHCRNPVLVNNVSTDIDSDPPLS